MCNPRRVRVHATRRIAEAWEREIKQAATARGDVRSEARLVQRIGDLLPPPARAAFEHALRASREWHPQEGEYRREVPGGQVVYRPDTGELEIVIELKAALEAVGEASLRVSGEVVGEVHADATGNYYDDSYGGHSKERAQQLAQAAADAKAEALAADRAAALKAEAELAAQHELSRRAAEVAAEARRDAEHRLSLQMEGKRRDLDEQSEARLQDVQRETLRGIFQLVAQGYSDALQAYAAEHGENMQVVEEDGVIHIQFEMER